MARKKRSPDVEIEAEDMEELEALLEVVKREMPELEAVYESAEKDEKELEEMLEEVDLKEYFEQGQVWITVIPSKGGEK